MAYARSLLQLELLCRCYGIVHVLLYIYLLELCLTVNLSWRKIDVFEFELMLYFAIDAVEKDHFIEKIVKKWQQNF